MNILYQIILNCSDDAVWPKYNDQVLKLGEVLSQSNNEIIKLKGKKAIAEALNNIGYLANTEGDIPKAIEYYTKSLKMQEEVGDKKGMASTFNNFGYIYEHKGDLVKGEQFYQKSLKIQEDLGDKKDIAIVLNNIAHIYETQGKIKEAMIYHKKNMRLREEVGDKQGLATTINNVAIIYENQGDLDSALKMQLISLKIREDINDKKGIAGSLNNIGLIYDRQGDITKALWYYNKSLKIQIEIKSRFGEANTLNNISQTYNNQGNIAKALEYMSRSLKLYEEMDDKKGIAAMLSNIGTVYFAQGDLVNAEAYYKKSLKINEEAGEKSGTANSLLNLGTLYAKQNNLQKAFDHFNRSLMIREEMGNKKGIAGALNKIGEIYFKRDELSNALNSFNRSLRLYAEIRNKDGLTYVFNNLSRVYLKQKKHTLALAYCDSSIAFSKELGFPENLLLSENTHSKIDSATGNYLAAYLHYKNYIIYRDSIHNKETRKAGIKNQLKYDYEKKALADSIRVNEEKKVISAQLKEEKTKSYSLYGGLALVLIFSGFMVNRFMVTSKQKKIIELKEQETQKQNLVISHQKEMVEEKHKEITDSINYAERIQRSFLASSELLDSNLKEYFVFFQPKDVVSGDFYWASKLRNDNFILATADSTGHGVPGAIMSILNISSLERAVEQGLLEPAEIFNHTRTTIIERLKKDGSELGGKDGMDCSLISFDFNNSRLTYSAANNPVWIVREDQIIELVPDKMPVGKHDKDHIPFTQHDVDLKKGDVVYTLTDGLPDQFGGPKGKKFMYKKLKELLITISSEPMKTQKQILVKTLNDWKGGLEQVDDVCLIGIRV
jgi:tetratricopeptide (TPR) repeat protein